MVAAAVIGFVSDAMRKMADRARAVLPANDGEPMTSTWTSSPRATSVTRPGISPDSTWPVISSCRCASPSGDSEALVIEEVPDLGMSRCLMCTPSEHDAYVCCGHAHVHGPARRPRYQSGGAC